MSNIPLGTVVSVSDGTPRPPERFTKKLDAWKTKNFLGVYCGLDLTGWHAIQELPDSLAKLAYLVIKRPTPTLDRVSVVDGTAPLFPVDESTTSVRFEDALEADIKRLKIQNGMVHTFVHAPFLSGADISAEKARVLLAHGKLNWVVPDRYRSMGHTLSRIDPKTGEIYYFETVESSESAAQLSA
jgi:hypothetical protein